MSILFVTPRFHLEEPEEPHKGTTRAGRTTDGCRAAMAIGLALVGMTVAVTLPARAQEFGAATTPTLASSSVAAGAPRFQVRFNDANARAAAAATPTMTSGTVPRGPLFGIGDALKPVTGVGGRGGNRARSVAESAETFTLELASPLVTAVESVGRIGASGARYSFTPQGLTVAWPASGPVNREGDRFRWDTYLKHNLRLLACLHGKRILFEEKTRRGMREPLLRQWRDDIVAIPRRWGDEDPFVTNYVGHPMMGAVMGYLEVVNHPVHARLEFGDRGYWKARGATLVAAAVASTQFEIGPLSEATMGLHPSKQGLSDFVVTPLLGTGLIVAEDAIDRYVIVKLETGRGAASRRILRCALNPSRAMANLVAFRAPWRRDTRPD
jgi:hypothetical protein